MYVEIDPDSYNVPCRGESMSGCNGWQNVLNMEPATTEWTGSIDNTVDNGVYDAHFLAGNYYQWNTATAGTGATTTSMMNATSSICPRGRQLPVGGSLGEFQTLLTDINYITITQSPYYFVPAALIRDGAISNTGDFGNYTTSTAGTETNEAYNLYFTYVGTLEPDNETGRYYGQSVRCIAR